MQPYQKTSIPALVSVRSIVAVYHQIMTPQRVSNEVHDFPELLYVEKGPHITRVEGQVYRLETGQALLYPPMARHQTAEPSTATLATISFEMEEDLCSHYAGRVITLTSRQRRLLASIVSEGQELFDPCWTQQGYRGMAPHPGASTFDLQQLRLQLELLLIDLFHTGQGERDEPSEVSLSNRDNYKKEQFDRLTDYLKAHLKENLTLEQVGQHCGMSISALRRLCQEQCGCAPMAYFTDLKIVRAKRLIRESSMNFTQIAEELGFHAVHYFSKQFKEKTCMSPTEYARSVSQKPPEGRMEPEKPDLA